MRGARTAFPFLGGLVFFQTFGAVFQPPLFYAQKKRRNEDVYEKNHR